MFWELSWRWLELSSPSLKLWLALAAAGTGREGAAAATAPCRLLATVASPGLCPVPGPAPIPLPEGTASLALLPLPGSLLPAWKAIFCPQGRAGGGDSRLQPLLPGATESACWPTPSKSSRGLWLASLLRGLPSFPAAHERPTLGQQRPPVRQTAPAAADSDGDASLGRRPNAAAVLSVAALPHGSVPARGRFRHLERGARAIPAVSERRQHWEGAARGRLQYRAVSTRWRH